MKPSGFTLSVWAVSWAIAVAPIASSAPHINIFFMRLYLIY
jgi:hypothetical protein